MSNVAIQLSQLRCNGCGAALEVPMHAKYVTCVYCNAELAVTRTGSAAYTEVLEAFTREHQKLRVHVDRLSVQNELAAHEQSWERTREGFLSYGKNGAPSEPSATTAIFGGVFAVIASLVIVGFGVSQREALFAICGFAVLVCGLIGAIVAHSKAERFDAARTRYERRRAELEDRLASAKRP